MNDVSTYAMITIAESIYKAFENTFKFLPKDVQDEATSLYAAILQFTLDISSKPLDFIELSVSDENNWIDTLNNTLTSYFNYFPM